MDESTGLYKIYHKNGVNYKRVASLKSEKEANALIERLKQESGSARFNAFVYRMRWNLANNGWLKRFGFTRYHVYVPIMEKHKYKRKLRKYAKKTRKVVDAGVRIWNRLNTPQNRKNMSKWGKRAGKMQESLIRNI